MRLESGAGALHRLGFLFFAAQPIGYDSRSLVTSRSLKGSSFRVFR